MKELIKIQSELKSPKNQRNNFGKYNYRSCEDILEAVKPLLNKYNAVLTITDEVKVLGDLKFVEAKASLKVGGEIVFVTAQAGIDLNRKGMDVAQSFGSSSSYARKYALNGLFLIDDTKEIDSVEPTKEKPKKTITDDELKVLIAKVDSGERTIDQLKKYLSDYSLTDLQQKTIDLIKTK